MTRDKALIEAIQWASGSRQVAIVYRSISGWEWVKYNSIAYELHDYRVDETRYVLPNGEVCKLS